MEATVRIFGLRASLYRSWDIIKNRKGLFSISWGLFFFFPLLHASAFLANFPNDLRQTYNLLACSPAKAPDPKRIREDSQCFLLPLLMPFLPVLPLATSMLMASIFLFAYLACGKEPPGFLRSERTGLLVKPVGWHVGHCDLQGLASPPQIIQGLKTPIKGLSSWTVLVPSLSPKTSPSK